MRRAESMGDPSALKTAPEVETEVEEVRPTRRLRHLPQNGETESGGDPDADLMLRAKEDDHEAFQALFTKYGPPLVSFAYRFVHDLARAEELVQDTFLQIYRARHRYAARARFSTYVYRVLTNLCLNELRRVEYQGRVETLDGGSFEGDELGRQIADETRPTAEQFAIGRQTAVRVQEALDRLPAKQRAALLLGRIEDLSYEEIASCLGTTVSAVKSLIFRATANLRNDLADLLENEDEEAEFAA